MITVTTPSVVNNLTPMTEGGTNNSAGTAAVSNVDFTNALNAQLTAANASANVVTTPILDDAALLTAQTALFAATAESSDNNQAIPTSAAQQTIISTTALTNQQPNVLVESEPSVTTPLLATNKSIPLANLATSEIGITNQDSDILSNVTDTLKFIATGSKLGDTLPEGQVIRLQNVNTSTPLTQQTVQAAVQQSVNTSVNTPATVLAQQAIPVQTEEVLSNQQTQTQSIERLDEAVMSDIQNKIAVESVANNKTLVSTIPTPIPTQAQTIQTEQSTVVSTTSTQAQMVQTEQPVVVTAMSTQVQMIQAEQPVVVTTMSTQAQMAQTEQPVVAIATPMQQEQIVQTEQSVAATTSMQAQTVQAEQPVAAVTPMQAQTVQTQTEQPTVETVTPAQTEKTVSATTVQIQTVQTEKPIVTAATEGQQNIQQATFVTDKNSVQEAVMVKNETSERSIAGEVSAQHLQNESIIKNTLKNNESLNSDEPPQDEESLLTQTPQSLVQNENAATTVEVSEKPSNSDSIAGTQENSMLSEQVLETTAPPVAAQTVPIQIEADAATFDAPSSSTPSEDKPALTPAKNLLADVLANRNNGGDTASNSGDKKGNDTSANTAALLTDNTVKNTLDNKSLETKPFASLLNNEKSEAGSALPAATNDKVAPQVAAVAVNKLAQDMKADVPALTRPLSHPNWNQEVGERIIWMNNRGISSAEIRMNPENMGPITVRIDVDAQQQTSVSFTAQNADVRTALEASIPKLREMLNSQNLNLADVNVSQQSSTSTDSNSSQRQNAQMAADASANGQNRQSNQEVDANGNPISKIGANGEEIANDEFANGQVIEGNGTNGLLSIFA